VLVGAPDYRLVNVSYLWAMILGYETALMDRGLPNAHAAFRSWIFEPRPDLNRTSEWYGGALLKENDNDHLRVVAQILRWLDEYEA
jgi:hypothetical protein